MPASTFNLPSEYTATGEPVAEIGGIKVYRDGNTLVYTAGMQIDADGSPNAYGPGNSGLDYTGNAGREGKWWGVIAGDDGNPIVQGPNDPSPGKYVSPTALTNPGPWKREDPRRYIDSEAVPYAAIPPEVKELGVKLGDLCLMSKDGVAVWGCVADIGPRDKLGEASIAAASALGIDSSPRDGGTSRPVVTYRIFLGTSGGGSYNAQAIAQRGQALGVFNA